MKDFSSWFTVAIFVDFKLQVRYADSGSLSSWTPLTQTLHFTPVTHSHGHSPDYVITSICVFSQTSVLIIPHLCLLSSFTLPSSKKTQSSNLKAMDSAPSEVERGSQGIQRICSSGWHLMSRLVRLRSQPRQPWPTKVWDDKTGGVLTLCYFKTNFLCSNRKVIHLLRKMRKSSTGTTLLREQGKRKL